MQQMIEHSDPVRSHIEEEEEEEEEERRQPTTSISPTHPPTPPYRMRRK